MTGQTVLLTALCVLGMSGCWANESCPVSIGWLNKACSQSSECTEANSECLQGSCKCTPGYFYSLSTKKCLATCISSEQTGPLQLYKSTALYLHDFGNVYNVSRDECIQHCQFNPCCQSVDYGEEWRICHQKPGTLLTYPAAKRANTDYDHYQKSCK